MNKLLQRQIKRHFGSSENIPDDFKVILNEINNTYNGFEDDINLLQNSIEISSQELRNAFQKQQQDAETQKATIDKIKEAIYAITPISTSETNENKISSSDTTYMFDSLLKLIEESKHAEKEISKLSLAVEQNPASIVITDVHGNIEYVNPKFCDLTGYSREEVLGQNPRILKNEATSPEHYKNLWQTILAGNEWKGEFHNRKKNGELYWELASISAVKNTSGEIVNFLAIKEDITKRKQTEETLENERALFRTIIDLIPDAVYVKDASGRKILANPKDVEFAGKNTEAELIGKTDAELYSSDQAKHSYEEDMFVLKSGQSLLNNEGTLLDQHNVMHSLLVSKVPLYDSHGKISGLVGVTHDMTDRKEAEEALQSKTSLLEAQTDATIDGILVIDNKQKRVLINKRAIELFNIPRHIVEDTDDTILLRHVVSLTKYPEAFLEKVIYLYDHENEISQDEIEFKNGMVLDRYSAPVLGKDGKNYGRIWTFRDITKNKLSEIALQTAHKSLSDILNAAIHTCIISTDTDGLITAFSKGAEKMLGYSAEEMIGKQTPACIHLESEVKERGLRLSQQLQRKIEGFEIFVALAKNQEHEERTWTYVRKDGSTIYVNLIITAIRDKNDQITGFLGVAIDITERKQAEEELTRVSTRLALATSAGGVGVWDLDILNKHLLWDDKMYELYGIGDKSLVNVYETWWSGIHSADRQRTEEEIQLAIQGTKDFDTEFQVCWPDGSIHNIRALATVLNDQSGNAVRMIGTNWDITGQKKTEAILQKARQDAEMANKAKSEFLANVSHEIRTPMNAIIGFAEILIDKIKEEKYRDYIKTILSSGRTLLSLINDILDLSKIEAGKLELENEPVNFPTVIKEIEQVFATKANQKQLSFEVMLSPDIPEYIIIDQIRLHQILFNLVGNAIKFTNKGYIRLECFAVKTAKPDFVDLSIEIEDTGIGIPADQIETIFEAFTQQSGQSNRRYEGTGLGLAISKKLIDKMHGTISLQSQVGKGSTFKIEFKNLQLAEDSSGNEQQIEEKGQLIFKPATIMIVDDIDFNIKVLRTMLDFEEFTFIEASSGEEALELLQNHTPDIIFMDIRMTGMSGVSATEIIKNQMKMTMPVIAFTASAMQNQMEVILQLFDGFLRKPISKKGLIQTLQLHLEHHYEKNGQGAVVAEVDEADADKTKCFEVAPELIAYIQSELYQEWQNLAGSLILFEIEDFSDKLLTVSQTHHCQPLITYAQKLKNNLQTFNVELIESTIKEFDVLFKDLIQKSN